MWDEITYPFLNFNGATVEVQERIRNFTPHFTSHVIKLIHVSKRGHKSQATMAFVMQDKKIVVLRMNLRSQCRENAKVSFPENNSALVSNEVWCMLHHTRKSSFIVLLYLKEIRLVFGLDRLYMPLSGLLTRLFLSCMLDTYAYAIHIRDGPVQHKWYHVHYFVPCNL